jgi:diguanylate cyclase (GGDEF)-like protein
MIDADHFKAFNDMFGHQAGDGVLQRIAACIADSALSDEDCAARYGGEEFALLLVGPSAMLAGIVAEKIRISVEMLSADKRATTVSIGFAEMRPDSNYKPRDLIEAADKALYRAKSAGRNRCVAMDMAVSKADVQAA